MVGRLASNTGLDNVAEMSSGIETGCCALGDTLLAGGELAVREALRGQELRSIVEIPGVNRAWEKMLESGAWAGRSERVVCEVKRETLGWCCC